MADTLVHPEITLKAGKCEADLKGKPMKVKPLPTLGSLFLYREEELVHFCWKDKYDGSYDNPELDLVMVPGDCSFQPYLGPNKVTTEIGPKSPINGRIFVLKFSSSSDRHFFWLQSKEQPRGDPTQFSQRDIKVGELVNRLLQGEDLDVSSEIQTVRSGEPPDEDDAAMEDDNGELDESQRDRRGSGTGGAGAGATGGDIREEGEEAREGGADGGRAFSSPNVDATAAVQNFLNSLQSGTGGLSVSIEPNFLTLPDLLKTTSTIPMLEAADPAFIDDLLINHIPEAVLFMDNDDENLEEHIDAETIAAVVESFTLEQKKILIRRVLRSPQFQQSLANLNTALRDGGLPSISDALGIKAENGGYVQRDAGVPLGGGKAVKAFLQAIRKSIENQDN